MATVAAYGGSGIGMGGGSSSSDDGDNDKRMRVVTDYVASGDEVGEETDEEVAEITESKVARPNSDLRNLTLKDDDLPPKLRHMRKMASKKDYVLPPKMRHKRKMALNEDDLPPKLHKKSKSTENLKRSMEVSVKRSRVRNEITTRSRSRASSAPIPALPPHLAEDSDQDQYVDITGGVSAEEEDEIDRNPIVIDFDVGKKQNKKRSKKRSSKK